MPTPGSLPVPRTPEGGAALEALLADPGAAVLAVDFDGTLAPIVDRPEDARALPAVAATLAALARYLRGIAIITGRPANQAVEFGGFAGAEGLDGLVVLGAYGRERWDAKTGKVTAPPVPEGVDEVRRKLPAMLAEAPPGVHVEDKGSALVVHTRQAAEPAVALGRLQGPLAAMAERHGLVVEQARLAIELRPPGFDKGRALRDFVHECGARIVVFAGDDVGDLPAYDAIEDLRDEGIAGLTVCSSSDEVKDLAARADIVVEGPVGVVGLLGELAEQFQERSA